MGSRVQGNLGQGSYSGFEKTPCCAISGTVFFSIDGHSEFCGASLKKRSDVTRNSHIFCYTSITLLIFQKTSLSLDLVSPYQKPAIESADLVQKKVLI